MAPLQRKMHCCLKVALHVCALPWHGSWGRRLPPPTKEGFAEQTNSVNKTAGQQTVF